MPSILITGAAGFIGQTLSRYFESLGWQVYGLSRNQPEHFPGQHFWQMQLPSEALSLRLESLQPEIVVHCSGNSSVPASLHDPEKDYRDNALVTFSLLEAIRKHCPAAKLIFLSSAAVYGEPTSKPISEDTPTMPISPYGYHKLQSEIMCQEFTQVYGLATAILRIFSAYGQGLKRQVIWDLCCKLTTLDEIVLQGTGEESRDFIHVSDVCAAIHVVIKEAPLRGEVYNVAGGREITINRVANLLADLLRINSSALTFNGVNPKGMPANWLANISKIQSLGFEPQMSFEAGLANFVNWFRLLRQ